MTIEDAIDNEIIVIFHFLKAYYRKYYENTHFKPILGPYTKIITINSYDMHIFGLKHILEIVRRA